ncbi:MAG: hypothetical protein A2268_00110 [Candidatus Raymondbacteria bacterium RifOxyA12_full_50_37]|uniref:Uncharacterized protein n=1 Tax=Candidatus Raymondbacteria bacterium RIFOXYD12_FULL_49_13 TaxID=1817890 RepID=A0A1F7F254_UNCRA|nr:MAG: hypothetical protein A2268_00110 [Candidatus Raymondbacteria bacterium RifOxyA12_full_50_37]OGJ92723.1 MAG: hypothetical protein A2248_04160 [Candidatus Raymondbacteria bacterium RIFOXYA2_FULL_49_16]OGJ95926.1 MAG: hypothetical protein A2487_04515 [Candidatus Raymondbacteria bacterium RifOxyC12_full_50_8]OGK00745.1 MAG: hypothetical protein A2519_19960 [Candidatus Raymondbacteria bacterium RIFOXYD12_FULL_49_13]OGK04198.1 MAG: hypothetical protein A2350_02745 [Candidatus Raymondbacteria 
MTIEIKGNWKKGLALDLHTESSTYLGTDETGHDKFDTKRTKIGQLVYDLKYSGNQAAVPRIVEIIRANIKRIDKIDVILPVPPSKSRSVQPVHLIADALGAATGIPVIKNAIVKKKETPELKNIKDPAKREEILKNAFSLTGKYDFKDKKVLFIDDLYRSGATLRAITSIIKEQGQAADIFVLTLTKTRSNR